mmetsp:Transcript_36660/g.117591  ORF Transcript_36660/g.117591 Transcript_36660/m.117591 type:complete len:213 (-) Transcript_36660:2147-2785(-)
MASGFTGESSHEVEVKMVAAHRAYVASLTTREGDGAVDLFGDGRSFKKVQRKAKGDALALPNSRVDVHYTGWVVNSGLIDDKLLATRKIPFDSSRDRAPLSFVVRAGQVILGWDVGVATMAVGEKAFFLLHPDHAYGQRGAPPVIPPNSFLLFEVELLDVRPANATLLTTPQIIAGIFVLLITLYYVVFRGGSGGGPSADDEPPPPPSSSEL